MPLSPVVYLRIACVKCAGRSRSLASDIRLAVPEIPEDRFLPCPVCGTESDWALLATGETVRPIPFFEQLGDLENLSMARMWAYLKGHGGRRSTAV